MGNAAVWKGTKGVSWASTVHTDVTAIAAAKKDDLIDTRLEDVDFMDVKYRLCDKAN